MVVAVAIVDSSTDGTKLYLGIYHGLTGYLGRVTLAQGSEHLEIETTILAHDAEDVFAVLASEEPGE